jgi:hypothetical protein
MKNEVAETIVEESAREIKALHGELEGLYKTSLKKVLRVGELLIETKEYLPHGHFCRWIKNALPFTDRTARRYMRLFDEKDLLKSDKMSDLGVTAAYKLIPPKKKALPAPANNKADPDEKTIDAGERKQAKQEGDDKERKAKWGEENPINQDAEKFWLAVVEQISKTLHDGHDGPIKRISHEALFGLDSTIKDLKGMYDELSKLSVFPPTM